VADAWQAAEGGLLLKIRLTPKADRDALNGMVEGPDGPAVAARVRAVILFIGPIAVSIRKMRALSPLK